MALTSGSIYLYLVLAIVLFTVIPIHEFAHGYVAYKMGDDTADKQGRLTLNPFTHLDLFGTLAMFLIGFGWAKPVPVDPRNFKNPRRGMAISALAGPAANVLLSLFFMIVYKILLQTGFFYNMRNVAFASALDIILSLIITISLRLAVFNFLPIPPLDGYKIFGALLPKAFYFTVMRYERIIFLVLVVLLWTGMLTSVLTTGADYLLLGLDILTSPLGRLL